MNKTPKTLWLFLLVTVTLGLGPASCRTDSAKNSADSEPPSTGAAATAVSGLGPAVAVTVSVPQNSTPSVNALNPANAPSALNTPTAGPSPEQASVASTPSPTPTETSNDAQQVSPVAVSNGGALATTMMAQPITSAGRNSKARFSPDGDRILFVSRDRPNHHQAQIYELHLGLMKEKRITFHDGADNNPRYLSDGQHFLFDSSTDAIKDIGYVSQRLIKKYFEKPATEPLSEPAPTGSDIFLEALNGRSVERLTPATPAGSGTNYDADCDPRGKKILFSAVRSTGFVNLSFLTIGGWLSHAPTELTKENFNDLGARFSTAGDRVVYSRQLVQPGVAPASSLVLLSKLGAHPVSFDLTAAGPQRDLSPVWKPASETIVFTSNRGGKFFNLYSISSDGSHLTRMTESDFDQLDPVFSPDGKHLIFTAIISGRENLYKIDF